MNPKLGIHRRGTVQCQLGMVNIARSLQSERVSVRAFCKVCERRRWGGHVGTFQYDPNKSHTWRFPINQRVSRFKVGKNVAGYVSEPRPRSVPSFGYHSGDRPLRLRCSSGHRLRELDAESVMRMFDGAGERVRLGE